MPEHVTKRVLLLSTIMVRDGNDKGLPCLAFCHVEGDKEVAVFVLKSWLLECAFNHDFSLKTMLHRAALSNRFTRPGRYIIPAPLLLGDAAQDVPPAMLADADKPKYAPHLLSYFDVPMHAKTCPLHIQDRAKEAKSLVENWNFQPPWKLVDPAGICNCFRKNTAEASCTYANDKLYAHCTETVAESLFVSRHMDVNVYCARSNELDKSHHTAHRTAEAAAAIGVYPQLGIKEALSGNGTRTRSVTDLSHEERVAQEERAEWAARCRLAGMWCADAKDMAEVADRIRALGYRISSVF